MCPASTSLELVPELRFAEFSEIWVRNELSQLASIQRGRFSPRPRNNPIYYGGEIPFVQTSDVVNSRGRIENFTQTLNEKGLAVSKKFPQGTILITIAANIGYSGVLQIDMACPDSLVGISCNDSVHNYFLNYLLEKEQPKMDYLAVEAAQKNINIKFLEVYLLTVAPRLKEQQKIADFLKAVDARIGQLAQKKALLEDYKKGVMQQLFTQAIRFKDDDGSEYPDWETKSMEMLYPKIRNGFVGTATPYYCDSGVQYVQGRNVKAGKIQDNGFVSVTKEFHSKHSKSRLEVNDILMVQSGHVGECAVVTDKFNDANCHAVLVLTPFSNNIDSRFYVSYFYSDEGLRLIHKIRTGNTIAHILSSDLKKELVPKPCVSEQAKIANFLSAIDDKIQSVAAQIDETKTFKKGLLQQMFV